MPGIPSVPMYTGSGASSGSTLTSASPLSVAYSWIPVTPVT